MAGNAFVSQLMADIDLTEREIKLVEGAGVRSYAALYGLLQTFPSLGQQGLNFAKLSAAAVQRMGPRAQASFSSKPVARAPRQAGARPPPGSRSASGIVVPFPGAAANAAQAAITGAVTLHGGGQWPAKDQGDRGTCVAFAAAACGEHRASTATGAPVRLSEQFVYWASKNDLADRQTHIDGTTLEAAHGAWSTSGACEEHHWPYDPVLRANDVTHEVTGTAPSAAALQDAASRAYAGGYRAFQPGQPGAAAAVLAALQAGRPVAVHLPLFSDPMLATAPNNWESQLAYDFGLVTDPPATAIAPPVGHAVCITGFEPDPNEANGGDFIFRNSWGTGWASKLPAPGYLGPEPGYGQVSATYVEEYLCEMLVL